jgi:hypothetical protein
MDSYSSRYFSQQSTVDSLEGYPPNTPIDSPPSSPTRTEKLIYNSQIDYQNITHFILSQSTPTTQTTLGDDMNLALSEDVSLCGTTPIVINRSTSTVLALTPSKKIHYEFRKQPTSKSCHHEIYLVETNTLVYRKMQGRSWGLENTLFKVTLDGNTFKVAEARRRAFQKQITIDTWIDENKRNSQDLTCTSPSNIIFEYETFYKGARLRWKRPSLLSRDLTCEIKLTKNSPPADTYQGFIDSDSDDDDDDHDHHSHKTCRRWKLLAEFDGRGSELGRLSINNEVKQVDSGLEASLILTCSTLLDLI